MAYSENRKTFEKFSEMLKENADKDFKKVSS